MFLPPTLHGDLEAINHSMYVLQRATYSSCGLVVAVPPCIRSPDIKLVHFLNLDLDMTFRQFWLRSLTPGTERVDKRKC